MMLTLQDLDDLAMAVDTWIMEYTGAAPEAEIERMERLCDKLVAMRNDHNDLQEDLEQDQ